ncbi:MAG: lytic transglycosylase domain-containing protein [Candidatus Competibacteraceae bacterium]|nr:lytic transglycosylase domain-containing protein [Candidatus Competibacteraceae bacterium]
MRSRTRGLLTFLTMLVLAACATEPSSPTVKLLPSLALSADSAFPAHSELQPQVTFWRNVYTTWKQNQVVLHDDRYLDIIYGVLTLPGASGDESQTADQKAFIKGHYETLKDLLRQVETKTATNLALTPSEQALANTIKNSGGGAGALFGASDRLRTQRGLRERFKRGLEISGRYDATFRKIFYEAGLPEDLAYLPHVESSFQNHAASSAGAVGMWQFMPGTARRFGMLNAAVDERRDPVAAAHGAARYLRDAHDSLGSWPLALTSYNHGVGGMRRAQDAIGNDFAAIVRGYDGPGFGFASRNFYAEFLAAREIARNPQRYFPEGVRFEPPLNLDRVRLRQTVDISTLASYYDVNAWELGSLNQAWNSAAQQGRISLPAGTMVWLPAGTITRLAQKGATEQALVLADTLTTARLR